MAKLNHHFQKLSSNYLFPEIERKANLLREEEPNARLINLGIGDVTLPLSPSVVSALKEASLEMGDPKTFQGYGSSQGYLFLRELIAKNEYTDLPISADEIFISNGAKCDLAHFQELFDQECKVALPDPTYPVYLDATVMSGRAKLPLKSGNFGGILYINCMEKNQFQPLPPKRHADLIYLASPNNPTGVALSRKVLEEWVAYAKREGAVILFDGAYDAYIESENTPRSIYEIEGATSCAIEIRSYSKSAGFTGLRCSYSVVPHTLTIKDAGSLHSLHTLWKRRHDTKFNGVPYPVQRAAAALYTPQGKKERFEMIQEYKNRSRFLLEGLKKLKQTVFGGIDAPYIWWKAPTPFLSWEFFDYLLKNAHIITTPGRGFGLQGEGFVRLSAFSPPSVLKTALERLERLL